MKKMVTLLRLKQDRTPMQVFENDFIVNIPQQFVGNEQAMTEYCEEKFRTIAQKMLDGPDGERILAETCYDFNWLDFTLYATADVLKKYDVEPMYAYQGDCIKDMIFPRICVEVEQDEVLC